MSLKKIVVSVLSSRKVARGYIGREAKRWTRKVYRHYVTDRHYSLKDTRWAIKRGFMPEQVELMGITEENYRDTISAKEYAFLRPLNGGYSKWISDKVTVNSIFKPYRDNMPKCYYHLVKRDGETMLIPLQKGLGEDTLEDVVDLLKEKGHLRICRTTRSYYDKIAYADGKFFINDNVATKEELLEKLDKFPTSRLITEAAVAKEEFKGMILNLTIINEQGDDPRISDAYLRATGKKFLKDGKEFIVSDDIDKDESDESDELDERSRDADDETIESYLDRVRPKYYSEVDVNNGKTGKIIKVVDGKKEELSIDKDFITVPDKVLYWDEIKKTIDSLARFVPQLEFFGVSIVIGEDKFYITRLKNNPRYPVIVPFNKETSAYLKRKVAQKKLAYGPKERRARFLKKLKLKIRAKYAKTFFPKGLLPYLSIRWFQDLKNDFKTNKDTTFKQKIWAAKHGFLSYRLPQYGITPDNYQNFISDFEYKWLRHINNKYRYWCEDKITIKYICSEYNECFPEYYYHIILKNGNNKVIPMMDCPEGFGNHFEDIFKLVHEKKVLALKPDEGSHGDGFYKFEYVDGKYLLNHNPAEKQDVLDILEDVNNQYIVTEYINMHNEIKRIYDGAVNTIRMIVFKKDGKNPVIGNAYMRFGSKKTGAVDNMGAGGMFAKIDIDTGCFYDSKIITENEIKECLYHPDTGVKIEGILPNWEQTKQLVLEVAKGIPQLEYFGFDLAITENGVKFPEINRFPDYPAIEKYTDKTIDYLLYKLEAKKKKYGYEDNKNKTLVHLPRR